MKSLPLSAQKPETSADLANPARRRLLQGSGLVIAFMLVGLRPGKAGALGDGSGGFGPNAFVHVDLDGAVHLVMPKIEMGQGSYTGEATMIAEELNVGLDQVIVEHAPPNVELYGTPGFGQVTGGSTTVRSTWTILRKAGATARIQLVAAAAQRWKVDPASCTVTRGVITHGPSGRTLSYGAVAQAAAGLPMPPDVPLKAPKDFTLIGKSLRRVDTSGKVDGSVKYGIDAVVPGMKIATVMSCPHFGGKLKSVDQTRARQVPGFVDVIQLDDAVAVVGEHFWAAKQGLAALDIVWDRGPNAAFTTDQMFAELAKASQDGTPIVAKREGDLKTPVVKTVSSTYRLPMLSHATMEPLNALVSVTADACDIWVGTQVPTRVVDAAMTLTGLPKEKISVHNHYMGGGFGRRLETDSVEQAIALAKQVQYPLKLIWTREQDIRHDYFRPAYYDRISAGLNADGLPAVWTDRVTSGTVIGRWLPVGLTKEGLDQDTVECAAETPYELPNRLVEWVRHDMPVGINVGWWRGVGPTHNLFVVESFIDELAHAAGKDPLWYRQSLIQKNPRALAVLNLAAEKIGWGGKLPPRVGRGIAVGMPFGSFICTIAEVEVSPQGEIKLLRAVSAVDCGITINPNTIEAQVQGGLIFGWTAALYNGITLKEGAAVESNFHDYRMMRINQAPEIEVHHVQSGEDPGGIGETGTAIAAPCLANAIFAATGVRIYQLPIDRALLVEDKGALKKVMSAELATGSAGAQE